MIGLPYVPFFPIRFSKHIYVFVEPIYDSLHYVSEVPEFALKPFDSDELLKYEWADTNKNPYNRYRFDIKRYSPDTLDIIFIKKYLGYDLPKVTFIATKKVEYAPIEFPAH